MMSREKYKPRDTCEWQQQWHLPPWHGVCGSEGSLAGSGGRVAALQQERQLVTTTRVTPRCEHNVSTVRRVIRGRWRFQAGSPRLASAVEGQG